MNDYIILELMRSYNFKNELLRSLLKYNRVCSISKSRIYNITDYDSRA